MLLSSLTCHLIGAAAVARRDDRPHGHRPPCFFQSPPAMAQLSSWRLRMVAKFIGKGFVAARYAV